MPRGGTLIVVPPKLVGQVGGRPPGTHGWRYALHDRLC